MSCEKFRNSLAGRLDGEIPIGDHILDCLECRKAFQETRDALLQLDSWTPEVPEVAIRRPGRPLRAVFATAAAFLVAGTILWLARTSEAPSPPKVDYLTEHQDGRIPDEPRYESPNKYFGFVAPPRQKKDGQPEHVVGYTVDSLRSLRATESLEDMAEKALRAHKLPRQTGAMLLSEAARKAKFRLAVPTYLPDRGILTRARVSEDGRRVHLVYWTEIGQFSIFLAHNPAAVPIVRTIITSEAEFKLERRRLLDTSITIVTSELSWSHMDWISDSIEFFVLREE